MQSIGSDELALLQDQGFLKAKKQIDTKVTQILLESQKTLSHWIQTQNILLPKELSLTPRKIARGENYADMPYWVSDFPASMKGADLWSFRTVVWWGHEISFCLLLAGKYKKGLSLNPALLKKPDLFFTRASTPWKLEFDSELVGPVLEMDEKKILQHFESHDFIKLSIKENLENINNLTDLTVVSFEKLIGALGKLA